MKRFFLLLLIFTVFRSYGQLSITVFPVDSTVCSGGKAKLWSVVSGSTTGNYFYQWFHNGALITDSTRSIMIIPKTGYSDTGIYYCMVSDSVTSIISDDSVHLHMRLPLHIDTLYRYNALACPGDSTGQMKILVSGGDPPYTYNWGGGSHHQNLDTIGTGFKKGTYQVTVMDSDSTHCISKEFTIEVLKLPKVTFKRTPPDTTIYLSNPFVTVSFSDTVAQEITHWDWDFGDKTPKVPNLNPVTHAYSQTGLYYIQLHFWDTNDCDSTVTDQIKVQTAQIFIPNAFIPGTGDLNGHLQVRLGTKDNNSEVDLSMVYLSNEMIILNRWGNRVYEKANYMSGDWDGGNLSAGVYYYIFKCHGEYGDDIFKGAVVLKRP